MDTRQTEKKTETAPLITKWILNGHRPTSAMSFKNGKLVIVCPSENKVFFVEDNTKVTAKTVPIRSKKQGQHNLVLFNSVVASPTARVGALDCDSKTIVALPIYTDVRHLYFYQNKIIKLNPPHSTVEIYKLSKLLKKEKQAQSFATKTRMNGSLLTDQIVVFANNDIGIWCDRDKIELYREAKGNFNITGVLELSRLEDRYYVRSLIALPNNRLLISIKDIKDEKQKFEIWDITSQQRIEQWEESQFKFDVRWLLPDGKTFFDWTPSSVKFFNIETRGGEVFDFPKKIIHADLDLDGQIILTVEEDSRKKLYSICRINPLLWLKKLITEVREIYLPVLSPLIAEYAGMGGAFTLYGGTKGMELKVSPEIELAVETPKPSKCFLF